MPRCESIPGKVSGAWVFRDTRLPVATVIENLEDLSVEEVMEQFDVTREQITAVLDFVAESLKPEYDFGIGERGKFFQPNAELRLPIYLNADVQAYLAERVAQKGIPLGEMVNTLLKQEIQIIESLK